MGDDQSAKPQFRMFERILMQIFHLDVYMLVILNVFNHSDVHTAFECMSVILM